MRKSLAIMIVLMLMFLAFSVAASPAAACKERKKPKETDSASVKEYGNIEISGGTQVGHFDDIWNLMAGELKITFTYDATGLVDDGFDPETFLGTIAIGQLGVRDTTATDLEPFEKGVWLNTLYDIEPDTFDPDKIIDTDWDGIPDTKADEIFDLDDQLILQRGGPNWDETDYDLPLGQGNPFASSGVWFDRDGVSSDEAQWWDFDEGVTYNTNGIYDIELLLKATSETTGEAYLTINGIKQGFWSDEWSNSEPDMYPAGMTFNGDVENMQIFYGIFGIGAVHKIYFNDIKVVQSLEFDLDIEIDVSVIDSVIDSNIIKNIPEDVKISFDLDVETKVKCKGDIEVEIEVEINVNDNVKVNVDIDIEVTVAGSSDDVDVEIEIYVKDAGDVRLDGVIDISDVEDDANSEFEATIKNSQNVWVDVDTELYDIGDDVKTKTKINVKNSLDVWIAVEPKVHDISDDAKVWVIIRIRKSNDIDLKINAQVNNVLDDSKIWLKVNIWKNNEVTTDITAEAWDIGDKSKIKEKIWIY
jgi:hypothetical protein